MKAVLYDYWRSSASYRLRIALGLADIAFETRPINLLAEENRQADYLAINPQGLVPTLLIDGNRITQSLAAIEYLNDAGHGVFLPDNPVEKARVRTLAYAIAMEIHPICNLSVSRRAAAFAGDSGVTVEWMKHFMLHGLGAVDRMLKSSETGLYCHGDRPTMADICLLPQVYNALRRGIEIQQWKHVASIAARLRRLGAFAAAHPDNFKPGKS